jgi:hypothetical protein
MIPLAVPAGVVHCNNFPSISRETVSVSRS